MRWPLPTASSSAFDKIDCAQLSDKVVRCSSFTIFVREFLCQSSGRNFFRFSLFLIKILPAKFNIPFHCIIIIIYYYYSYARSKPINQSKRCSVMYCRRHQEKSNKLCAILSCLHWCKRLKNPPWNTAAIANTGAIAQKMHVLWTTV